MFEYSFSSPCNCLKIISIYDLTYGSLSLVVGFEVSKLSWESLFCGSTSEVRYFSCPLCQWLHSTLIDSHSPENWVKLNSFINKVPWIWYFIIEMEMKLMQLFFSGLQTLKENRKNKHKKSISNLCCLSQTSEFLLLCLVGNYKLYVRNELE